MKPYQRGDVVIIDVPIPASGHVQGGKRPWVIVQNNMGNQFSPTSIVVPLTAKMKRLEMPTHVALYGRTWSKVWSSVNRYGLSTLPKTGNMSVPYRLRSCPISTRP